MDDFKRDFNLSEKKEDVLFEQFINYCLITRIHPEAFTSDFDKIERLKVGGGEDTGIDGLAIIVNDHFVISTDAIDGLRSSQKRLDAKFVFIQSKMSPEFKAEKVASFIFGVKDFFAKSPVLKNNDNIDAARKLKDHIYSNSIEIDINPTCHMYYATTGKWLSDQNVLGRATAEIKALDDLGIFSTVEFIPVDADGIGAVYKEIKNKVKKEIIFEKRTTLPEIEGIREAYIGILPVTEYLKLICGSDGKIQKNLFYDNVRDFMGSNSVNDEIATTIVNKKEQDKFAILNNGVTIVAKHLHPTGDAFKISDFQIVNGCQTSHVLFDHKDDLQESKAFIPIKLIITDDYEVANQITKATNRQTEVKVEAFTSLEPYHRTLEEFYNSFQKSNKLYYSRRSNQYENTDSPIPKDRIITLAAQTSAFISVFLNDPHSTHRYYGELLKTNAGKLFQDGHEPYMYYVSSFALNTVERLLRARPYKLAAFIRKDKLKYHLLMTLRIIICGYKYPNVSSREMRKYCEKFHSVLLNEVELTKAMQDATNVLSTAIEKHKRDFRDTDPRELHRFRTFTNEVIRQAQKHEPKPVLTTHSTPATTRRPL